MNHTRFVFLSAGLLTALALTDVEVPAQAVAQDDDAIEVQTRGPMHEAFAQPQEFMPEPSPLVPKAPPPPLPEQPPEDRPAGANVVWIGGYWAWNPDQNDFVWVTGTFRNSPPGRRYVSGYWQQEQEGWRWVEGFWAPADATEMPYLPQPPPPIENGPATQPPDDNSTYVPGNWIYRDSNWQWQSGYWQPIRPGYVFVPPRYVWTPAGCLYQNSYLDYPLDQRGLCFAPVVFHRPLWQTPGWFYRPSYCFRPSLLFDSLFLRPGWGHYYYGDYYGAGYAGLGFRPWIGAGHSRYDPLYSYTRWQHRNDPNWHRNLEQQNADRFAGRAPLPPRTLAAQAAVINNPKFADKANGKNRLEVVRPVTQLNEKGIQVTKQPPTQVTAQKQMADKLRDFSKDRGNLEQKLAKSPETKTVRPVGLNLTQLAATPPAAPPLPQPKGKGKSDVQNPPAGKPQPPTTKPAVVGKNQPPETKPQPPVTKPQPPVTKPQPPVTKPPPPVTKPPVTKSKGTEATQAPVAKPQPPANVVAPAAPPKAAPVNANPPPRVSQQPAPAPVKAAPPPKAQPTQKAAAPAPVRQAAPPPAPKAAPVRAAPAPKAAPPRAAPARQAAPARAAAPASRPAARQAQAPARPRKS